MIYFVSFFASLLREVCKTLALIVTRFSAEFSRDLYIQRNISYLHSCLWLQASLLSLHMFILRLKIALKSSLARNRLRPPCLIENTVHSRDHVMVQFNIKSETIERPSEGCRVS